MPSKALVRVRQKLDGIEPEPKKEDRQVEKFDGTLDGIAITIKGPEESNGSVRRRLIDLLRHDETMERFVEVADAILKRKHGAHYPSLDLIARNAHMEHSEVVGAIAKALHRYSFDYSRIIAAANMPRVMSRLASEASETGGHADRVLFLRATGHLPTGVPSKGTSINVQQTTIARSEAAALQIADAPSRLPNFEDDVKENVAVLRAIDVL